MTEEDEGRGQDWPLMVHHDEVIALVLPHQVGHGFDLQVHIAVRREGTDYTGPSSAQYHLFCQDYKSLHCSICYS